MEGAETRGSVQFSNSRRVSLCLTSIDTRDCRLLIAVAVVVEVGVHIHTCEVHISYHASPLVPPCSFTPQKHVTCIPSSGHEDHSLDPVHHRFVSHRDRLSRGSVRLASFPVWPNPRQAVVPQPAFLRFQCQWAEVYHPSSVHCDEIPPEPSHTLGTRPSFVADSSTNTVLLTSGL